MLAAASSFSRRSIGVTPQFHLSTQAHHYLFGVRGGNNNKRPLPSTNNRLKIATNTTTTTTTISNGVCLDTNDSWSSSVTSYKIAPPHCSDFSTNFYSSRCFSRQSAAASASSSQRRRNKGNNYNHRKQQQWNRNNKDNTSSSNNKNGTYHDNPIPNPNSPERVVRLHSKNIISLGEMARNCAVPNTTTSTDDNNLHSTVQEKDFWMEGIQAIKWWTKQGTIESVEVSFRLLDALADLSLLIEEEKRQTTLSSQLFNTKTLNLLVQNWLVGMVIIGRGGVAATTSSSESMMTPQIMFEKLEKYRINSRTTTRTRRNLRPDLITYQILMEAPTTTLSLDKTPPLGYNEFIVRHLMEIGKNDLRVKPDMKTVAHILYGWSIRGQVVPISQMNSVLGLVQDFSSSNSVVVGNTDDAASHKRTTASTISDDSGIDRNGSTPTTTTTTTTNLNDIVMTKDDDAVEIFNKALFALARSNSTNKDSRGAEKLLSILNFMEFMAPEYDDERINLRPNVDTYNLVLNAFARVGKGAQAELILRNWVDRYSRDGTKQTAQPVSKSFTIVINGFGNSEESSGAKKAEGILRWQHELNNEGRVLERCIPPETITYNNVIKAWSWRRSDKGVDRCDELRKEMIKHNLKPDHQTYGQSFKAIALSNLQEKGKRAVQVWREMNIRGIEGDEYAKSYFDKCVALDDQSPARRKRTWKLDPSAWRRERLAKKEGKRPPRTRLQR